jgi:hypothetical protein
VVKPFRAADNKCSLLQDITKSMSVNRFLSKIWETKVTRDPPVDSGKGRIDGTVEKLAFEAAP